MALALYGGFSAPAPSGLGPAELAVGIALALAVGVRAPVLLVSGALLARARTLPWHQLVGTLAFVYLLWVPLVRAAVLGWPAHDIVRDVVPLVYLFLPLLLVSAPAEDAARAQTRMLCLAGGLALAGVLFALRWWSQSAGHCPRSACGRSVRAGTTWSTARPSCSPRSSCRCWR